MNSADRINLRTDGMTCAACSAAIEKALGRLDGVEEANANFSNNVVSVLYDRDKIGKEQIAAAIKKAGYDVLEDDPDVLAERERSNAERMREDLMISIIFAVPLSILAMGPMFGLNIPLSDRPEIYSVIQLVLCIPVLIAGRRFYTKGYPALFSGTPTMDTLIALGTTAAVVYSLYATMQIFSGDPHALHSLAYDSAAVIIALVSVGKYIESRSKVKTNDAVKGLLDLAPPTANVIRDGKETTVPAGGLLAGDMIIIRPGERIPADGSILEGVSSIDESMLTGESMPVTRGAGDSIYSGTRNMNGSLKMTAEKVGRETALFKIVRMIQDAQGTKAPVARVADKVAAVFVPVVIAVAAAACLIWLVSGKDIEFSVLVLISVLVIACPCALGLATPLAITVGTGKAAEHGILFKNAAALERSGSITTVILDKTGTITEGRPSVTDILSNIPEAEVIRFAASAEIRSEHPLAKAIVSYADENKIAVPEPSDFISEPGGGVRCKVKGREVAVGSADFTGVSAENEKVSEMQADGKTAVFVSIDGEYAGTIAISDRIRKHASSGVSSINELNVKAVMVTGDSEGTAKAIAGTAGIREVHARALPEDKVNVIKELQVKGENVAMVGDGINDAPALTQADIGIAIGSGTDIAIGAADVVVTNDDVRSVPAVIEVGRATLRNVKQNLFLAFCYNAVCIPIAAGLPYLFGMNMVSEMPMIAAAAMSLSSVSVVTNALRLRRFKPMSMKDREL
ncbi:MAG: heavy metal translocating P-type ATPase [Candidatus Methanoplasma sp.]|jgi:Cu+-exporting ATPase|nr:heavy metal translocating P-type ATPase [Candidatus Methanoplasma sp.]